MRTPCKSCGTRPELYTHTVLGTYNVSCYATDSEAIEDGEASDWCPDDVQTGWHDTVDAAWAEWEQINKGESK